MSAKQKIFRIRRNYNQWVNNQTLEDYALRFTAKSARKWSLARVANTALGAISFLALEAIGGAITLSYGFDNAALAIVVVGVIIFFTGVPVCYYAAKYGVDIDLLTRGAGFGYLGSTATSLIYASFTFIFFALEAAIMATALELLFNIPLALGYIICSIVIIPLVTHGITFISRFQLWTQPFWLVLQLLPFIFILWADLDAVKDWQQFEGLNNRQPEHISLIYFGAASAILFSLMAQIGEQVDYLRFLPEKTPQNRWRWWLALLSSGPGWIIVGAAKMFAGSLLAYIALRAGYSQIEASDPTRMYLVAFNYVTQSPQTALALAGIFVIIAQLKINVTNAYAGSIAWSNFFSRLTHSHPGRVVWLVFNVVIALLLMELGIYQAFENTLGAYAIVAVGWMGALVADLVINKPLGLSPKGIEFKRAYLYDINPVGVGSMIASSALGISCYLGIFGQTPQALAHFITLLATLLLAPTIAYLTKGRYYIARSNDTQLISDKQLECCVCQNSYEQEDIALCPAYDGPICSLCCSIDVRCQDLCKKPYTFNEKPFNLFLSFIPQKIARMLHDRLFKFSLLLFLIMSTVGLLLSLTYINATANNTIANTLLANTLWQVFFILVIIGGIIAWLFVLAHESRLVAQEESNRQNRLLSEEIEAHQKTDAALQTAKELAEAANNAKSRYLTGISHELRTPLNSMMGYAQLLEKDEAIPVDKQQKISIMRRSGEHLVDLIEGLLDISKIEAGRLDIHRDEVNIASLMDQLVYMFRLQAEQKGLDFVYQCEHALPELVATDEKRLRQIIINLLSNAIKFTEKGKISLSLQYKNQVANLSISDTGVGIAETNQERIFRPFERIRNSHTSHISGTGLGLTITRLLVDIMGGEITVSSAPQQGTTFNICLMLATIDSPKKEISAAKKIYAYEGSRKIIAIIDDDPVHRGLISDILSPLGFSVIEAIDSHDCLRLYHQETPDMYLMDISMPGKDGWATAELLRHSGCSKPIIMISANASETDKAPPNPQLTNGYITKPIKVDTLLEKISQQLAIKWVYSHPNTTHINPIANNTINHVIDMQLPTNIILDEMMALAAVGHTTQLKELLLAVEKNQSASSSFIQQMRAYLNQLQFEKMINQLQEYRGGYP